MRQRALVLVALALAVASPVRAVLIITDSPSWSANHTLLAEPYAFARRSSFDVSGPLVSVSLAAATCPPRFEAEPAVMNGALVLVDSPRASRCTLEQLAAEAARAGAAALLLRQPWQDHFSVVPGHAALMWRLGGRGAVAGGGLLPVVDVQQAEVGALVSLLRRGERPTARLAATPLMPSAWARMHVSAAWSVWQGVLALGACVVIELATFRLEAFIYADRGVRLGSIPQLMLLLELAANTGRVLLLAVDPELSRGWLPAEVACALHALTLWLALLSAVLFLLYFSRLSLSQGLASLRLSRVPEPPRAPGARCGCVRAEARSSPLWPALVVLACTVLGTLASAAHATVTFIALLRLSFLCVDLCVLAPFVWWWARARALAQASSLPRLLSERLVDTMQHVVILRVVALVAGFPALTFAYYLPWARYALLGAHVAAALAVSHAQCALLRPIGVRVLRGPLRRALLALRELWMGFKLSALVAYDEPTDSRVRKGSLRPKPPIIIRDTGLPDAGPMPAHLLLGVSLAMIDEFISAREIPEEATTLEVAQSVRELTASSAGWSIAEMCASAQTQDGVAAVAEANLFISHAQCCSFAKMLSAVLAYLKMHNLGAEQTYLWLDIFCIRQHEVEAEVAQIGAIERSVGRVVMVLDPWDAPVCLTRVWCLYEVVQCWLQGVRFELTIAPDELEALRHAVRTDLARVQSALSAFDARTAQATVEADKQMINALIAATFAPPDARLGGGADDGGATDAFNASVQAMLRSAIASFLWEEDATPEAGRRLRAPWQGERSAERSRRESPEAREPEVRGPEAREGEPSGGGLFVPHELALIRELSSRRGSTMSVPESKDGRCSACSARSGPGAAPAAADADAPTSGAYSLGAGSCAPADEASGSFTQGRSLGRRGPRATITAMLTPPPFRRSVVGSMPNVTASAGAREATPSPPNPAPFERSVVGSMPNVRPGVAVGARLRRLTGEPASAAEQGGSCLRGAALPGLPREDTAMGRCARPSDQPSAGRSARGSDQSSAGRSGRASDQFMPLPLSRGRMAKVSPPPAPRPAPLITLSVAAALHQHRPPSVGSDTRSSSNYGSQIFGARSPTRVAPQPNTAATHCASVRASSSTSGAWSAADVFYKRSQSRGASGAWSPGGQAHAHRFSTSAAAPPAGDGAVHSRVASGDVYALRPDSTGASNSRAHSHELDAYGHPIGGVLPRTNSRLAPSPTRRKHQSAGFHWTAMGAYDMPAPAPRRAGHSAYFARPPLWIDRNHGAASSPARRPSRSPAGARAPPARAVSAASPARGQSS